MELDKMEARLPTAWKTDDGTVLMLRHISAHDVCQLASFVRELSFGTRYFRFGSADFAPSEDEILRVCTPDPQECVHLLVWMNENGKRKVMGSARYVVQSDTRCEFAIAVSDSWKHHGVGYRLMNALIEIARSRRGIKQMYGNILRTNLVVSEFIEGCGFEIADSEEGDWLKVATLSL
jgi:acetyltransferase